MKLSLLLFWIARRRRLALVIVTCLAVVGQARANDSHSVVVLGDSLSAGYGIDLADGWVALLHARLADRTPPWRVINASVSGDTTDAGLARLPGILERHTPNVVIIELGANDGLRGQPPARIRTNLEQLITLATDAGAVVVLAGIRLPPNYGPRYLADFESLYKDLAQAYSLPLVPFLLEGVAGDPALMQADGLHPLAAGQSRILRNVWPALETALGKVSGN